MFQCIQHLVANALGKHILVVPPPILSCSFQEMGGGMMIYHEAKKLSHLRLFSGYRLITAVILIVDYGLALGHLSCIVPVPRSASRSWYPTCSAACSALRSELWAC